MACRWINPRAWRRRRRGCRGGGLAIVTCHVTLVFKLPPSWSKFWVINLDERSTNENISRVLRFPDVLFRYHELTQEKGHPYISKDHPCESAKLPRRAAAAGAIHITLAPPTTYSIRAFIPPRSPSAVWRWHNSCPRRWQLRSAAVHPRKLPPPRCPPPPSSDPGAEQPPREWKRR
jgi:hypothetical protein